MKKKVLLIAVTSLSLTLGVTAGVIFAKKDNIVFSKATDGSYWNHYAQVTPTEFKHGSKEFWANCSTHNFTLVNPGAGEDIREGVDFATTSYFEELTDSDPRYLPPLDERVYIKGYLNSLLDAFNHDPYSYIPNTMRPEGVDKVSESEVTYDFNNFVDVDDIKYGGYGEQWHMVIENIKESQRFYNITTYGSEVLGAANLLARAFLDDYYDNVVTKTFNESSFTAKIDFHSDVLTYNIQYISGINVPLFGEIIPQIDMEYVIATSTKTVRIQLGENNALKFVITPNSYTFGLEYGVTEVSRKAYFTISKDEYDAVEGHIYESKGLEWNYVVLYNMISFFKKEYKEILEGKAKHSTLHRMIFNQFYVGCTRSHVCFAILEDGLDEGMVNQLLPTKKNTNGQSDFKITMDNIDVYIKEDNSSQSWSLEGRRRFEQGEYALALSRFNVAKDELDAVYVEICEIMTDESKQTKEAAFECKNNKFFKEARIIFKHLGLDNEAYLMGLYSRQDFYDENRVDDLIKYVELNQDDIELIESFGYSEIKMNNMRNNMSKLISLFGEK